MHAGIKEEQDRKGAKKERKHRTGDQIALAQYILELRKDELKGSFIKSCNGQWLLLKHPPDWLRDNATPMEKVRDIIRYEKNIIEGNGSAAIITRTNDMAQYLHKYLNRKPKKGPNFICRKIESQMSFDEKIRGYLYELDSLSDKYRLRGWIGKILDELLFSDNCEYEKTFACDFNKFLRNRKKDSPKEKVRRLVSSIWDKISYNNLPAFIEAFRLLPEIATILSVGIGHPDYEAIGFVRRLSKSVTSLPNNISWQEFIEKLEGSVLQTSYLFLRQNVKGLYVLNAHQAKGREFDHVIIPWLSSKGEQVYEGEKSGSYYYEKFEDRRLLYVALTRAKKKITIIYPQDDPSPFLHHWKLIPTDSA